LFITRGEAYYKQKQIRVETTDERVMVMRIRCKRANTEKRLNFGSFSQSAMRK